MSSLLPNVPVYPLFRLIHVDELDLVKVKGKHVILCLLNFCFQFCRFVSVLAVPVQVSVMFPRTETNDERQIMY